MKSKTKAQTEWISRTEAGRRLGVSGRMVSNYVVRGLRTRADLKVEWPQAQKWVADNIISQRSGSYGHRQRQAEQQAAGQPEVVELIDAIRKNSRASELAAALGAPGKLIAAAPGLLDAIILGAAEDLPGVEQSMVHLAKPDFAAIAKRAGIEFNGRRCERDAEVLTEAALDFYFPPEEKAEQQTRIGAEQFSEEDLALSRQIIESLYIKGMAKIPGLFAHLGLPKSAVAASIEVVAAWLQASIGEEPFEAIGGEGWGPCCWDGLHGMEFSDLEKASAEKIVERAEKFLGIPTVEDFVEEWTRAHPDAQ